MNWGSASEFFAMGGYGPYVWGSYGVALVALLAEPWLLARRHRRALAAAADPDAHADGYADAHSEAYAASAVDADAAALRTANSPTGATRATSGSSASEPSALGAVTQAPQGGSRS